MNTNIPGGKIDIAVIDPGFTLEIDVTKWEMDVAEDPVDGEAPITLRLWPVKR